MPFFRTTLGVHVGCIYEFIIYGTKCEIFIGFTFISTSMDLFYFLNDLTCLTIYLLLLILITILGSANLPKITDPNNKDDKVRMSIFKWPRAQHDTNLSTRPWPWAILQGHESNHPNGPYIRHKIVLAKGQVCSRQHHPSSAILAWIPTKSLGFSRTLETT